MGKRLVTFLCALFALFSIVSAQTSGTLEGTYSPATGSEKCVSSSTCCCSTGVTTISSKPPNTQVQVDGDLDGGTGCRGFKSLSAVFQYFPTLFYQTLNATAATWTVPMYGDKYLAVANNDYTRLRVERTDAGSGCINVLNRISGSATPTPDGNNNGGNNNNNGGNNNNNNNNGGNNNNNGGNNNNNGGNNNNTGGNNNGSSGSGSGNVGSGKFDAIGSPSIMGAGVTEGFTQPDSSYKLWYGVLKANDKTDQYEVWMIIEPTSNMFGSIKGSFAYLHYISPTSSSPDTAVSANPITVKMVAQDAGTTGRQYKHSSVRVPNGLGMRFAFSYALEGSQQKDTQTFYFQASGTPGSTGSNSGSNTGSGSNPPAGGNLSAAQIRQHRFVGTYAFDANKCTTSSSCCCAVGTMVATASSDPTKITLKSTLDGGTSCNGMKDVVGDFDITSDTNAHYVYPDSPLNMDADMSGDFQSVSFKNSIYTCVSSATRTSGNPKQYDNQSPGTGNNNSGNGNTGSGTALGYSDNFVGAWTSDNSCRPTTNCCCLTGTMNVLKPSDARSRSDFEEPDDKTLLANPNALYAKGNLDGGVACFRKTSMSGTCLIENPSHGSCTLQGITFNATMSGNRISISNSMYQNCESVVIRTGGPLGASSYAPPTVTPMSTLTICAYVLLAMATLMAYLKMNNVME